MVLIKAMQSCLPLETPSGSGFIWPATILACSVLMLNGSTVKGRFPVSMAYMFTPLERGNNADVTYKNEFTFFCEIIYIRWTFYFVFCLGWAFHEVKILTKYLFTLVELHTI